MPFDKVKFRARVIWLLGLFAYLGLPAITYYITSSVFDLKRQTVWNWVLGVALIGSLISHWVIKYLTEGGFEQHYGKGGSWEYLSSRFAVDRRPGDAKATWEGPGRLDREDILFAVEAALLDKGIYLNIQAMGRLVIPWSSIESLKRERLPTPTGWQELASVSVDGPEINLSIPWARELDDLVPQRIIID